MSSVAVPTSFPAKVALAARDIKLAHSVFALPFALLASFLARPVSGGASTDARFAGQLGLVVLCMVTARTWAMMVNRLADRRIDAANPRTVRRAVASGVLPERDARVITGVAAVLFVVACSLFYVFFGNPWPAILSVPVLAWIAFYSFTKRFTALCHLVLGSSLAASPLAAALAVDPTSFEREPALFFVAGFVLLWVAGFDVIYALQDVAFDRATGLRSIPSRLGPGRAVMVSRLFHLAAAALLWTAWRSEPRFGLVFAAACGLVVVLLVMEHVVLARRGEAGLNMAFFTINGVVSCVVGAAGITDLLL